MAHRVAHGLAHGPGPGFVYTRYRLPEFKRAFRFLIKSRKKLRFASLSFNQSSFEVRQLFNRQSKSSVKATHKHFERITAV